MAYLRVFIPPKIPRGPRGIDSRSPNPRGMKNCNRRFPESPRNESRRGIGIPMWLEAKNCNQGNAGNVKFNCCILTMCLSWVAIKSNEPSLYVLQSTGS